MNRIMARCKALMKSLPVFLGMVLLANGVQAQNAAAVELGKAKYDHSCAPCHGKGPGDDGREMLPGTYALNLKYGGELPPALEDRSDLTAPIISNYVRMGTYSMPPFRKTELTDAEIENIAAYLAESSKAYRQSQNGP